MFNRTLNLGRETVQATWRRNEWEECEEMKEVIRTVDPPAQKRTEEPRVRSKSDE